MFLPATLTLVGWTERLLVLVTSAIFSAYEILVGVNKYSTNQSVWN